MPIIQSYWYFANSIFSHFVWVFTENFTFKFYDTLMDIGFYSWWQLEHEWNYHKMLHDIVCSISFAALHCAQCWDIKQGHEKPKQDIFDRWLPPIWISSDPTTRYLDWSSGCYKTSSQCWSTSQSAYLDLPDVEFVTRVNNDICVK